MNLKKLIKDQVGKAIIAKAPPALLPLEPPSGVGRKAKIAGVLGIIAAVASALAQYLG